MPYGSGPYGTVLYAGTPPPPPSATSASFDITAPVAEVSPAPIVDYPATTENEVRVTILGQDFRPRGVPIVNYESLEWNNNFYGGNFFSLTLPAKIDGERHEAWPYIREHNYVLIEVRDVITDEWKPDFINPIDYYRLRLSRDSEIIEVRGGPMLRRRMILPGMDEAHPSFPNASTEAEYLLQGTAETVMIGVVNAQFRSGAIIRRRVPGLFFAPDQGRGGLIDDVARYDNLQEKLESIARSVGLGFQIAFQRSGWLEFQVLGGVDRSASVTFSPANVNIERMEIEVSGLNRYTTLAVGGKGEGAERLMGRHHAPLFTGDPPDRRALFLPGVDEFVRLPQSVFSGLGTFTLEGWVKWEEAKTNNTLFEERTTDGTAARVKLSINSSGNLILEVRPDDSTLFTFTSTFALSVGPWTWIAADIYFPGSDVALYYWIPEQGEDASESFPDAGLPSGFVTAASDAAHFGYDTDSNAYFHGGLSRWRLWGSLVPFESLLSHVRETPYASLDLGVDITLNNEWRFDDGAGAWVSDYTTSQAAIDGYIRGSNYEWAQSPQGTPGVDEWYGLDMREGFLDERDMETDIDLKFRADSAFEEQGRQTRVEVATLPEGQYRYKTHFEMGDIITVENDDWSIVTKLQIKNVMGRSTQGSTPIFSLTLGSPFVDMPAQIKRRFGQTDKEVKR